MRVNSVKLLKDIDGVIEDRKLVSRNGSTLELEGGICPPQQKGM